MEVRHKGRERMNQGYIKDDSNLILCLKEIYLDLTRCKENKPVEGNRNVIDETKLVAGRSLTEIKALTNCKSKSQIDTVICMYYCHIWCCNSLITILTAGLNGNILTVLVVMQTTRVYDICSLPQNISLVFSSIS